MPRILTMMVVLALAVAACGGDSDDSVADDGNGQPTQTQATSPGSTDQPTQTQPTAPGDKGTPEGSGASTATATIEGQTYNFSSEGAVVAQCLTDLFGIFAVQLPMVDDDNSSIQLFILHDGTDPAAIGQVNALDINIGDDDWMADESSDLFETFDQLKPGMSQVDSAEIDGRTVRGAATFVLQDSLYNGEPETATGTFEATCGEERTV